MPPAVALFVASQPISIAAPFLALSPCLTDDLLIMVARSHGEAPAFGHGVDRPGSSFRRSGGIVCPAWRLADRFAQSRRLR
ncbi:hypothetical protein HGO38_23985 [Rhizobium sp. CG5]|nr:hypothetical protein [Rhizobium sp. CG5]